jgi:hypothetical protein
MTRKICSTRDSVNCKNGIKSFKYTRNSDRRPASNRCPILKSMADFYVTDICTSNLCLFLKFSNRRPILKSMTISHFLNYKPTSNDAINLTNKSTIDLRIWEGRRFENTLKSDLDLRQWRERISIWGVDADLSLSYILHK